MEIGQAQAGKIFIDLLGICQEQITIDASGWAAFPVGAGSVSVWIEKK